MANNTFDTDKLAEAIAMMQDIPERPSLTDIFINSRHEKTFKDMLGEPSEQKGIIHGALGYTQTRVTASSSIPAETWKIPLLSESLDVSPEVRDAINKTIMGFGKCPVVYVLSDAWKRELDKLMMSQFDPWSTMK